MVIDKRTLLPLMGAGIVTAAFGCAGPAAGPAAPDVSPSESITRGGTFAYGARGGAQHLNWYREEGGAAGVTFGPIYESLVSFDYQPGKDFRQDFTVVPRLAESWQRTDDTTYVFKVRQNAKWHDGEPVTAADVVFTYEYARDPKNAFRLQSQLASVDRIEQVDQHTVRLTTRGLAPGLLGDLSEYSLSIFPKHIADRGGKFEEVAIGSGPFKLESYNRSSGASYVRHDGYWREGRPYIDRVKVTWPLDNASLLAAFAAGQNDILQVQDTPQLETARAVAPNLQVAEYVGDVSDGIYMRIDRRPFNDIRVRRAVHLALDRDGMQSLLMQGKGTLNPPGMNGARTGWVIPHEELTKLPGYRQPKDQDIAEAKRLLAEAGYGQQPLRFSIKYIQGSTRSPQASQVISEQLRSAGIQAELAPTERGVFFRDQVEGNFDTWVDGVGRFEPVPTWRSAFHSKGRGNGGQFNDPDLDKLIDRLDVTMDPEEQKRTFIAIQRLMLDKVYTIAWSTPLNFAAWQPWVKDYVYNPAGQNYPRNWDSMRLDVPKVPKDR